MLRKTLLLLFVFISLALFCQDTIYFDSKGTKVKFEKPGGSFKVTIVDSATVDGIIVKTYLNSGVIISEARFLQQSDSNSKTKSKVLNGISKHWFENGQLKNEIAYKNNLFHGSLKTYWPNGKLRRNDSYEYAKLMEGNCYDSIGNKIDYFTFETMPKFPGGDKALFEFLSSKVRYPVEAQKKGIQGRVITQFVVNVYGEIVDITIARSVSPELDAEAIRVLNSMPEWIPGKQDGEYVRVRYTLPVNFRLQ